MMRSMAAARCWAIEAISSVRRRTSLGHSGREHHGQAAAVLEFGYALDEVVSLDVAGAG